MTARHPWHARSKEQSGHGHAAHEPEHSDPAAEQAATEQAAAEQAGHEAPNEATCEEFASQADHAEPSREQQEGPAQHAKHQEDPPAAEGSPAPRRSGKRGSLRAQLLIALIGVLLGVGIVVQVQHTQQDQYSALRQDDLVRLLDEVTQRNQELTDQRSQLRRDLAALTSGSGDRRLAEDYATLQAILAGTVPVEGSGVVVNVEDDQEAVDAQRMVHMLEEIRNAGAEGISVNGERLTATSAFVDTSAGLTVDGEQISPPYEWRAIGDPQTLAVALDIPGGALASMRNVGAQVSLEQRDLVQITAVREVAEPQYAEPTDLETAG